MTHSDHQQDYTHFIVLSEKVDDVHTKAVFHTITVTVIDTTGINSQYLTVIKKLLSLFGLEHL